MKTKTILGGLIAFLLIATTIVSLAYADHTIGVTALWTENDRTSLSVDQGERAELLVLVQSTLDYTLRVELLRGSSVIRTIVPGTVYPATVEDSTSSHILTVDTGDLAGVYAVRVHAVNTEGDSTQWLTLDVNTAPLLSSIPDRAVDENRATVLVFTTSDADDDAEFTLEAYQLYCILEGTSFETCLRFSLPEEFRFITTSSGVGRVIVQPGYDFVTHPDRMEVTQLIFRAYDGRNYSPWEYATVTVNDVNRLPEIFSAPVLTAQEGSLYRYDVRAADGDREDRLLQYYLASFPITSGLTINSRGRISWTPTYDQAGEIEVAVYVTDGLDIVTQNFTLTVENTNRAPVLDSIGDRDVAENEELNFTIMGSDPDGDVIMFSVAGLPEGAAFDAATQTFNWTPTFEQTGNYDVTFTVSDGSLTDEETITISVGNVNRPPVLDPIGDQTVNEGELLEINFTATDPDGDALLWWTQGLPLGSILAVRDDGTGSISWTPNFEEAGVYTVTLFVSDGELEDSEVITVTVVDVPLVEICDDSIDNDGDGLVDEDCAVPPVEVCGDDIDNDGDGLVDEDCAVPPVEVCGDDIDNDGDGLVDEDCAVPPVEVCGDGLDNDGDGLVDEDCAVPPIEICGDSLDNDGDGLIDEDCPVVPPTPVEVCGDGLDNDGDGLIDEDCAVPPVEVCGDDIDNDGDGLIDEGCPPPPVVIRGCTDPTALNYQPQATVDNGSCAYPELDDILELTRVQLSSEVVAAGDTLLLSIRVANEGDLDLEDLRVTILAYDLGLNRTTSRFDLDEGRAISKSMVLSIPEDTPAGDYLLKITVGNREHRESAYRAVSVQ